MILFYSHACGWTGIGRDSSSVLHALLAGAGKFSADWGWSPLNALSPLVDDVGCWLGPQLGLFARAPTQTCPCSCPASSQCGGLVNLVLEEVSA